jgi:hypothetical protein
MIFRHDKTLVRQSKMLVRHDKTLVRQSKMTLRQGKMVLYRPLSLSGKGLGIGVNTSGIFNSLYPLP